MDRIKDILERPIVGVMSYMTAFTGFKVSALSTVGEACRTWTAVVGAIGGTVACVWTIWRFADWLRKRNHGPN